MTIKRIELNENDHKLIGACENTPLTLTQLSKVLNISLKNISVRVDKLKDAGYVIVEQGKGNEKKVRSTEGSKKIKAFMAEVLDKVEKNGGEMSLDNYMKIYPFSETIGDPEGYDKTRSVMHALYHHPALLDKNVKITEEGKKFLKENKK